MVQYRSIKERFPDCILFFRLGDFYEMFDRDAAEASSLLDLTLTQRAGVPMCGVPYHAAASYISRLLSAGKKVAVCEQTTGPGKGLMNREVLEVITPGTVLDDGLLLRASNNYLVAIARSHEVVSLAYADVSTGELAVTAFPFASREQVLRRELHRLEPREVITQESLIVEDQVLRDLLGEREGLLVNRLPDWSFDAEACRKRLERQLKVANLKGYGLDEGSAEILAAGVLLEYLGETAKRSLDHMHSMRVYADRTFVELDEASQRNLELVANLQDGSRKFSLLSVLDQTRTSPGARRLRRWILMPLKDLDAIQGRLSAVESLYHDQVLLSRLRGSLGSVLDLERLTARVAMEKAHAKDLLAIASSLEAITEIRGLLLAAGRQSLAGPLGGHQEAMKDLAGLLTRAICDEPATALNEGNLIRRGFDAELDRLHALKDNAREILEQYLEEERKNTGIGGLKLRYNRIIGYYFEVTKSNLSRVPSHFIRRQSLVGGERFTTERLADLESEINDASERVVDIERTLFLQVRSQAKEAVPWLLAVCDAVSDLDVFQSLAFAATVHGYVRPALGDDASLVIRDGRHPVVEAHLPGGGFVPNSLELLEGGKSCVILTGPNMAGKSTFLRQVALITLMAQMGSFVPASEAKIGLVDSIFCRVGASDNLARGESTFLVEMNETAHILRAATGKSLLIMDEIGRGTSTRDGLAIARAVCLFILARIRARTLFATHFHELTDLDHPAVVNLSMDVRDQGGEIVFLKRVRQGPSSNSYGIHVARLAGLPAEVLAQAETMLEGEQGTGPAPARAAPSSRDSAPTAAGQGELFSRKDMIIEEIRGLALDSTTPLDAINRISKWKKELDGEG
jgi:DNA mismatch repair protein MutS